MSIIQLVKQLEAASLLCFPIRKLHLVKMKFQAVSAQDALPATGISQMLRQALKGLYFAAQYQLHDWHAGGSAQASSTAVATSVSQVVATALAKALATVTGTASSG